MTQKLTASLETVTKAALTGFFILIKGYFLTALDPVREPTSEQVTFFNTAADESDTEADG